MPEAGSSRLKRAGIAAGLVAAAALAFGIATRQADERALELDAADAGVPTVTVVRPARADAGEALVLPGNLQGYNSAAIYARTNGYIRRWLVDIGDRVAAGQVLAILEAPEVDQQLAQALADYQSARANEALARTTADRWTTLLAKDAVSRQEADEKRGDLAARAALANAALANVKRLRALQGFTRLTAPFGGTVTSRSAQIGALVTAGNAAAQPLFTVSDLHRIRIYVSVPQGASAQIRPGMGAALTLPEYPGRAFRATLTRNSGAIDPRSGAVLVELQAANPDRALKPGAYAQVRFDAIAGNTVPRLPTSAVLFREDGASVAVVGADGRVALKTVTLGRDDGKLVEVQTGLTGGERVIDTPPDAIQAGDRVRVAGSGRTDADG